jgi:hypothetical protein
MIIQVEYSKASPLKSCVCSPSICDSVSSLKVNVNSKFSTADRLRDLFMLCVVFITTGDAITQGFHSIAGFPNVVGAIDGTQIPITAPMEEEHLYVCRKEYHSLNVQAILDVSKNQR